MAAVTPRKNVSIFDVLTGTDKPQTPPRGLLEATVGQPLYEVGGLQLAALQQLALPQTRPMMPGPADPFDRKNDPLQEVPMMMQYPFGEQPQPDIPEPRHPFWMFPPRG
jgi:hypothetical protein